MSDNYVLDILLAEDNDYMGTGFSRKQYLALKDLIDQHWHPQRSSAPLLAAPPVAPPAAPLAAPPQMSPPAQLAPLPAPPLVAPPLPAPPPASPPAQKPYAPELPPQPISTPAPVPARSFPPSPSVEDIEEVEEKQVYKIPLRNIKKMRQKYRHGAAKKMPRIRVSKFFESCIGLPSKFGAVNICFSRDEDPDAWYTTMLNHKQKIRAIPIRI